MEFLLSIIKSVALIIIINKVSTFICWIFLLVWMRSSENNNQDTFKMVDWIIFIVCKLYMIHLLIFGQRCCINFDHKNGIVNNILQSSLILLYNCSIQKVNNIEITFLGLNHFSKIIKTQKTLKHIHQNVVFTSLSANSLTGNIHFYHLQNKSLNNPLLFESYEQPVIMFYINQHQNPMKNSHFSFNKRLLFLLLLFFSASAAIISQSAAASLSTSSTTTQTTITSFTLTTEVKIELKTTQLQFKSLSSSKKAGVNIYESITPDYAPNSPCKFADPQTKYCLVCHSGCQFNEGICYWPMPPNCAKVNNNTGQCVLCQQEYIYNKTTKKCAYPKPNYCDIDDGRGKCILCLKDYILTSGLCFCPCTLPKPDYCDTDDKRGNCLVCLKGYYLLNGRCFVPKPPNCQVSDRFGNCLQCMYGYFFRGNRCALPLPPNCQTDDGNGYCIACKLGYVLNNGKCVCGCTLPDIPFCIQYNIYRNCSRCQDGYTLYQGRCYRWEPIDPYCQVWLISYTTCLCCRKGYYLSNNKCVAIPYQYPCSEVKDYLRTMIFPWTPKISNPPDTAKVVEESRTFSPSSGTKCTVNSNKVTLSADNLFNLNLFNPLVHPGSMLQSYLMNSKASQGLTSLNVAPAKRSRMVLSSKGQVFTPITIQPVTASNILGAITYSVSKSQGYLSPDVFVQLSSSKDYYKLVDTLHLDASVASKLGLESGFDGSWKNTKNRYIIAMIRTVSVYYIDMVPQNASESFNDGIGTLLNCNFTKDDSDKMTSNKFWGTSNPPIFIPSVYYGSLFILSVEQNSNTRQLLSSLKDCLDYDSVQFQTVFNKLTQQLSVKIYSRGPFDTLTLQSLRTGKWTDFMKQIPANDQTITSMHPLAFDMKNLANEPYYIKHIVKYNSIQCQDIPKRISFTVDSIIPGNRVVLKTKSSATSDWDVVIADLSNLNIIDLSSYFPSEDQPFAIFTYTTNGRRNIQLSFKVDGAVAWSQMDSCSSLCPNMQPFKIVQINKYSGQIF